MSDENVRVPYEVPAEAFPAGVLHNTVRDRFHPVVFRPAPMPSCVDVESGAMRHRSKMHHAEGFATLAEAEAHIAAHASWRATGIVWEWDGVAEPRITHWFTLTAGQILAIAEGGR